MIVRPIFVLLLLVALVSATYSRFGSNKVTKPDEAPHPSINDQMMHGSPIRYYGRFRDGSDDVLNRYFNRL